MQRPALARTSRQTEIANRRKIVAANLLGGATLEQVASALGVSVATVHRDYKDVVNRWRREALESVEQLIALQVTRYNMMLNAIWDQAIGTAEKPASLAAQNNALRILERIDKISGLEKPPQVTVNQAIQNNNLFNIQPVDYRQAISALAPSQDMIDAMPVEVEA